MRFISKLFIAAGFLFFVSCSGEHKPATPLETFKAYTKAISQKDTTTMKLLLSDATIKMHEQEAKAQNLTVDDIVKRETLFSQTQKEVKFRNEKIEGEKGSLEVQNSFGAWEIVPFVKENGAWKIDKKGYADQLMQEIEKNNSDDKFNQGRLP